MSYASDLFQKTHSTHSFPSLEDLTIKKNIIKGIYNYLKLPLRIVWKSK